MNQNGAPDPIPTNPIICAICGRQKTTDPRVHTNWRTIELDGVAYHVCSRHFPLDSASAKAFQRSYEIVLRKLATQHQQQLGVPQSEEEQLALATAAMSDKQLLTIKIPIMETWYLVATIQMATRNPGLSAEQRQRMEAVARQFQSAIVNVHPEVAGVLEAGWNPVQDGKGEN